MSKKYLFAGLALLWSILLTLMLLSNLSEHRASVIDFARSEAEVLIQHIKSARIWNASHGGLYVEVSENTKPNPYLEGLVEERDITTPMGKKLTLINPAYMTRLINETFNARDKRIAHITSLKPIRPANKPDAWETKALQAFERGAIEMFETTEIDGKPYMRLMRPLITKAECLKCHAQMDYKVGDIRGGITASVPFTKHANYLEELNLKDSITYTVIWLLGLLGLTLGHKHLSRGEARLQKAETEIQILSSSVEQASEAIMITDHNGVIRYVNPAFEALTGYSKQQSIGSKANLIKSDRHPPRFFEEMWHTLISGEPWQGRIINRRKDGNTYPAMVTISPIKNSEGETTHYVGSQQDMGEHERLEEQLQQAQKMEALGTLVGGIAHDFNNTLAGITGNIYLTKKVIGDNRDAIDRLETIESLSFRSAQMISQLLAFSREGIQSLQPLSVAPFVKETVKMQRVTIPENIRISLEIIEKDMQILGDITQLQQVMMNLLNNARDAVSSAESPCINIKVAHFKADHAFMHRHSELACDEFAAISVEDNGTGIESTHLEHIFEPFFTTKEVGKGSGLGLSMVYGAIQSHRGIVEVRSKPGSGSCFTLLLPLLDPDHLMLEGTDDERISHGHGETILLVDDEETVVETGKAVLESIGYKVRTAANGQEATAIYRESGDQIDLLLMDVVMPEMGGIDAALVIRMLNPKARIIFATGYDRTHTLQHQRELEHEHVISKPFTISEISQLIRAVLEA